ncbi:MAG: HD domain-containing protein [Armatimonadetes bacterium]|nr:HD domain-containing protein [Armatimonadota bacterium]
MRTREKPVGLSLKPLAIATAVFALVLCPINPIILGSVLAGATIYLFSQQAKTERKLEQAQIEVLRRLARAAEHKDGALAGHCERMARIAQAVGRSLGWSDRQAEIIYLAAKLHDVGKIGIPDSILQKPGPLTLEENELMRSHVWLGANLLAGDLGPVIETAHDIALAHHERWDGTGYPQSMTGHEIPLSARIAAISDVFDALVCEREYKAKWTADESFSEIERLSGTHFDPDVVAAFLRIRPEIERILAQTADPKVVDLQAYRTRKVV